MPTSYVLDDQPYVYRFQRDGVVCQYRRAYSAVGSPRAWLGPGATITTQPTASRDATWDPIEDAITDSTVDAGTGFVGDYAPAVPVMIIFPPRSVDSQAAWAAFGVTLTETQDEAMMLAREMTPQRGDLIIHPNGQRYVVGAAQRALGMPDRPIIYDVSVERRKAGSAVYTA